MAVLAPFVFWQLFDNNGDPLSGGQVETYEAGTTTPKQTFVDADETATNENPVPLDSFGRASIWLDEGAYKFILKDSSGATIAEVDDFSGDAAGAIVSYNVTSNLNLTSIYDNANIIADGTFTINLLPVADAEDGFQFRVYNEGSGVVTIDPNSSETINNVATIDIAPSGWAFVYCTGTEWFSFGDLLAADNTFTGDNTFSGDNIYTGNNVFQGVVDVTNVNAETSSGGNLRTNGGANCISWGSGGSVNSTLGGNMSGASTYKLVNMIDPTSAQDYATKNYVDVTGMKLLGSDSYNTYSTFSTAMPMDDSIPQITEGTEILTATVTPSDSTKTLIITWHIYGSNQNANQNNAAALFVDSTANALAVAGQQFINAGQIYSYSGHYELSAGSTNSRTYRIRVGTNSGNYYVNGTNSSRLFGGVLACTLAVYEA